MVGNSMEKLQLPIAPFRSIIRNIIQENVWQELKSLNETNTQNTKIPIELHNVEKINF